VRLRHGLRIANLAEIRFVQALGARGSLHPREAAGIVLVLILSVAR
jgi:hypothetical protein